MSCFERDPNHPWRAASLSGVMYVPIVPQLPPRLRAQLEVEVQSAVTEQSVKEWVAAQPTYAVPTSVASDSIHSRQIRMVFEMGDARHGSKLVAGADDGEARVVTAPYDQLDKGTELSHSYADQHFAVKPTLNEQAVDALLHGHTMDAFAKIVDAKLARPTAPTQGQGSVPDMLDPPKAGLPGGLMVAQLEELRSLMQAETAQADYGWRLWSLANVVCHVLTLSLAGEQAVAAKRMYDTSCQRTLLSAKLLYLRSAQITDNSWWYIGDEMAPTYRALFVIAGRGLHNYVVAGQESVYSRAVCEPEVQPGETMVFTALSGTESLAPPAVADYLTLLNSPSLALSCYYAYAQSVGVGQHATTVLMQALHGPHMWGPRATLPYYPVRPKLDAMTTLVNVARYRGVHSLASMSALHANAPLVALRAKVALGAGLGTFKVNRFVDVTNYIAGLAMALRSDASARMLLANVFCHMSAGNAGLHWLSPFRDDAVNAITDMVAAFRRFPHLLSCFNAQPVKQLAALYTVGVDMHNGVLGEEPSDASTYVRALGIQLAAGLPASLQCEQQSRNSVPPPADRAWLLTRAWDMVVMFVCYKPVGGKPRKLPPAPLPDAPAKLAPMQSGFSRPPVVDADPPQPQLQIPATKAPPGSVASSGGGGATPKANGNGRQASGSNSVSSAVFTTGGVI